MQRFRLLLVFSLFYLQQLYVTTSMNIALHAQASPFGGDKIVGSVVTTDGLKAAFRERFDVNYVEIFYPFEYHRFGDFQWDMVIIEGWFPSIYDFIIKARIFSPNAIVLYYMLDPAYPHLNVTTSLDVDGYLTNSQQLADSLLSKIAPTLFVMLAANPNIFTPPPASVSRQWNSIYVGAGGDMLKLKPKLSELLHGAAEIGGLVIYGHNWESVTGSLKSHWKGPLPRNELQQVYASAQVVIASMVESQGIVGMINNRVFEALSCGAIILSTYHQVLYDLVGDLIFYPVNTSDTKLILNNLLENPLAAEEKRLQARKFILQEHTWNHRAIEIIDFYHRIAYFKQQESSRINRNSSHRRNKKSLGVIVDRGIVNHSDFVFIIRDLIRVEFSPFFNLVEIEDSLWLTNTQVLTSETCRMEIYQRIHISKNNSADSDWSSMLGSAINVSSSDFQQSSKSCQSAMDWLIQFDVLLVVASAYSPLEKSFHNEFIRIVPLNFGGRIQRRALYLIGIEEENKKDLQIDNKDDSSFADSYDVIFFRSQSEIDYLKNTYHIPFMEDRLQHLFGLTAQHEESIKRKGRLLPEPYVVFVCFSPFSNLCTLKNRRVLFPDSQRHFILLIGGTWQQWTDRNSETIASQSGYKDFSSMYFVQTDHPGNYFSFSIIASADIAYFMHKDERSFPSSTGIGIMTDNILWPVMIAAKYGTKIHLWINNRHTIEVLDSSCADWDQFKLKEKVQLGLFRLIGLATSLSAVNLIPIHDASHFPGGIQGDSDKQCYISTSNLGDQMDLSPTHGNVLWFKVEYSNFIPGRDGEVCIHSSRTISRSSQQDVDENTADSRDTRCFFWPFRYLILEFQADYALQLEVYPNQPHLRQSISTIDSKTIGGSSLCTDNSCQHIHEEHDQQRTPYQQRTTTFDDTHSSYVNIDVVINGNIIANPIKKTSFQVKYNRRSRGFESGTPHHQHNVNAQQDSRVGLSKKNDGIIAVHKDPPVSHDGGNTDSCRYERVMRIGIPVAVTKEFLAG